MKIKTLIVVVIVLSTTYNTCAMEYEHKVLGFFKKNEETEPTTQEPIAQPAGIAYNILFLGNGESKIITTSVFDDPSKADNYITKKKCLKSLQDKIVTCPNIQDLIKEYQQWGVKDGSLNSLLDILCYSEGKKFKDLLKYILQKCSNSQIKSDKRLFSILNGPSVGTYKKDIILLLISNGANPFIKYRNNKNAFDLALEKYGSDFVKQMEETYAQFKKNCVEHLVEPRTKG